MSNAYQEGWEAFHTCISFSFNPYSFVGNRQAYDDWETGFYAAQKEWMMSNAIS